MRITFLRVASSSLRLKTRRRLTGADGLFATIRASASLSSTSAVNRSDDVVSSAASLLAVGFFVFPLVATVPSHELGVAAPLRPGRSVRDDAHKLRYVFRTLKNFSPPRSVFRTIKSPRQEKRIAVLNAPGPEIPWVAVQGDFQLPFWPWVSSFFPLRRPDRLLNAPAPALACSRKETHYI